MSHWKGCERCALIPKQRERHPAAADCAAGKSEFEKPYAWLRFQRELEYRLSGNLYCRFIPRIPDSCKTRISQSRGFLTLLHVGEIRSVGAANQMNGGDAPSRTQPLADCGLNEQQIVIEVCDNCHERARTAIGG
ncbi:hypothetical protein PTKU46_62560 [Paraburkholderia terrae]